MNRLTLDALQWPTWRRRFLRWALAMTIGASAAIPAGATNTALAQNAQSPAERPWLGLKMTDGPLGGILVRHVIRTSPADRGGVKDGDMLLEVDGTPVDEPSDAAALLGKRAVGDAVTLKVRRGGKERELSAALVAFPGATAVLRMDKVGTFAPSWTGAQLAHGSLPKSISALRGKVAIVDFWASWCAPCRVAVPELTALQSSRRAKGLVVVGVTPDSVQRANEAVDAWGIEYAVVSDRSANVASDYGVHALPTLYVVDKRGVIRDVFVGFHPKESKRLAAVVDKLLAEPGPPKK